MIDLGLQTGNDNTDHLIMLDHIKYFPLIGLTKKRQGTEWLEVAGAVNDIGATEGSATEVMKSGLTLRWVSCCNSLHLISYP